MALIRTCFLILATLNAVNSHNFLGSNPEFKAAAIRDELRGVLSEVLGDGHGVDGSRIANIRASLEPLFRSLPKNQYGRLGAPVMRYAVTRYFSQRHGWIVKGFEPHAVTSNVSEVANTSHILQSKLPGYVRSALEEKFAHHGFALEDAAVMIAAVERLAFDEVIKSVEDAFRLNSIPVTQGLTANQLKEILSSYLITEMLEGSSDDVSKHMSDKANVNEIYPHWDTSYLFLSDVMVNDGFERRQSTNPFAEKLFSFEDVTRIAQRISEEFGAYSNHECHDMRSTLAEMDVHQTGRVKLSDFYRSSKDGSWQFLESSDYLRHLGALDESSVFSGPSVIIPNYIGSMGNCITSTPYYSVCCLSECDLVYQHLEAAIPSHTASAAEIINAVNGMPHAASMETKNVSGMLRTRLEEIAVHHSGRVPVHGRLLAQWLHFAFPQECPYPHATGTVSQMTPSRFEETIGEGATSATQDEVQLHLASEAAQRAPSPEAGSGMWSMHEVLLEPHVHFKADSLRSVLRMCAGLGMFGAFAAMVLKELPRASLLWRTKSKILEYEV